MSKVNKKLFVFTGGFFVSGMAMKIFLRNPIFDC